MSKKVPKIGISDLESQYPEVAKEWHPTKNGDLKPSDVFAHSDKVVWWICPEGHEYDMVVNNRTGNKKQICPICSNKRIVPGINDFASTNSNLLRYWDYEKNTDVSPQELSPGSNKYVWWKCEKGHSFRSEVYSMTHSKKGMNCPVCRNFVVQTGYNDMATTHPDILKEWDYEKNELDPTKITAGTNKKGWWRCEKGHSWEATISSRTLHGLGCPYCSNQKILPGYNDLGTLCPSINKLWDYEKNNGKTPADFTGKYSNKKIWLICENGHSYQSSPDDYSRGRRCPICCNKKIEIGYNDLATTHPDLIKGWDYEKNTDISPQEITYGSDRKVWWICEKGHSWKAVISSRTNGRGCPECLKETQTSLTEKTFSYYLSKYFSDLQENVHLEDFDKRELDIYIPSLKLAVEYDGHNWHKNIKNDLIKDNLCNEKGITLVRIREDGCPNYETTAHLIKCPQNHGNIVMLKDSLNELFELINQKYNLSLKMIESIEDDITNINESYYTYNKQNSLATKCPKLLDEWDYEKNGKVNPNLVSFGSTSKVWWKCKEEHSWSAVISSRVRGNGCPYCTNRYLLKGYNDLETLHPEIAKDWDYEKNYPLKPEDVLQCSHKKYWWKCEKGHSWSTAVDARVRTGSGCPTCAGQRPISGVNDLETLYPEVAKEWDYEKNAPLKPSDVLPGSEKRIWWICPKGHSYDTIPRVRTLIGTGCPVCDNKRILKGYNDLETLHPEIAKDWDYEKNAPLLPSDVGGMGGSHKRMWWKCEKGHSWSAILASRIRLKTGCPTCAIERTRKNNK